MQCMAARPLLVQSAQSSQPSPVSPLPHAPFSLAAGSSELVAPALAEQFWLMSFRTIWVRRAFCLMVLYYLKGSGCARMDE